MGIENLFLGFQIAISPYNLFVAVIGITLGPFLGVLPGLGGANGVAILLPLPFTMPPTSAIILLPSLYWGALFGGAIPSILFNIPGEPWSVATTFDGYPLARQGMGGQALTAAFTSSFVGALFPIVLISFFAPLLAEIALKFGPPEFFAIQLLTFSSFVGLGGGNPLKSLVSILLGFILAAVGFDIVTGQLRMTFGFVDLMKGFDFIVAVIGLFGIGEILISVEEGLSFHGVRTGMNLRVVLDTWRILPRYARTFVRGAFIGFWMGFKPGGATPPAVLESRVPQRLPPKPGTVREGAPGWRGSPGAAGDPRARLVRRAQQHDRHLVHGDLRGRRLRLQEARLPARAARAGARPRRPGRERAPPEPHHVAGLARDLHDAPDLRSHHGRRDPVLRPARADALVAAAAWARCPPGRPGDLDGGDRRPRVLAPPALHLGPEHPPLGRQRAGHRAGGSRAAHAQTSGGTDLGRGRRGRAPARLRRDRERAAAGAAAAAPPPSAPALGRGGAGAGGHQRCR